MRARTAGRWILRRYGALPYWVRLWPPVLLASMLWYLSSRPGTGGSASALGSFLHNAAHVVGYGALGAAVLLALPAREERRPAWLAIALCAAYGLVDEWHQSHVPGRHASIADAVSDGLGAALAVSALGWLLWRSERGRRALPWLGSASLLSVASATWLSW